MSYSEPTTHTTRPILTGTSIIAMKYKDGIILGADSIGSYGSMQRFSKLKRMTTLGDTLIAADGDYSDFQYLEKYVKSIEIDEMCVGDGIKLSPDEIFHRFTRLMYQRRSKVNPLWNNLVIGGVDPQTNEPFLASTDKLGTPFVCDYVATGFGLHFAQPVLESEWKKDMSYDDARTLLLKCLRICYYRDARAGYKVILAKVAKGEAPVIDDEPKVLTTKWDYEIFKQPEWGE